MREILCKLLNFYVLIVFFRIVLSWFPLRPGGIMFTVNQWLFRATEPLMGRARRVLPPMGQFDLSPIVVILFLQMVVGRLILGC
ncbi:MAG: YggT family protein [Actinomycetes bacterium]|jgi:YggT family protein